MSRARRSATKSSSIPAKIILMSLQEPAVRNPGCITLRRRCREGRSRESSKGERSKLGGHEGCGKVKKDVNGSEDPRNDRGERFPSPAAVFTFDQEEIHASKLLSFDKVGHDQNLCMRSPFQKVVVPTTKTKLGVPISAPSIQRTTTDPQSLVVRSRYSNI